MPQPDGSVKYMKDTDHKTDVTYAMPPTGYVIADCATGPC